MARGTWGGGGAGPRVHVITESDVTEQLTLPLWIVIALKSAM